MACFDTKLPSVQHWRMDDCGKRIDDSAPRRGGWIPGMAGVPAYSIYSKRPSTIPVLIAAPHGGRNYPASVLGIMREPGVSTLKLEDRFVDHLAEAVARETGASLLLAHAPRAMIDLNRAVDDMDWSMMRRVAAGFPRRIAKGGKRARSGLGLIPRRLTGVGELWSRLIEPHELEERIDGIHRPYHEALAGELRELRANWGAALLLDLHSMPPLAPQLGFAQAPQFVLGDRFGSSCDASVCAVAFDQLCGDGWMVSHNRPYAGGYVLDRHGAPQRQIHAVQLEVCRSTYLDSRLTERGSGFENAVAAISGLVRRLAIEIASLRRGLNFSQAAE